jgi:hypothetical protein
MPEGWLDRQMKVGRVLLMLDGLDEAEPELRDRYLFPWLLGLLVNYPDCHYLISSRPVGYPPGTLRQSKFIECNLIDFDETQIQEYARHWCTAVRLAQNELEAEARREGQEDGQQIVEGFQEHPYISDLARNPLMLSAICLVNYFEGGKLPTDRALLYRLCVEGLLHNWDQRRGIRSEFGFTEKLRTCREVALVMQTEDRAEFEADRVRAVFAEVLGDTDRASKLLEHIRYRTGLLLERRPGIFGFAHLTFQEYLAARAIHEGNQLGISADQLIQEHGDGRWKEVIALYCGLATTPSVRSLIEQLVLQADTSSLSEVLTEAYFSSGSELAQDYQLRQKIINRVASLPGSRNLRQFPVEEVRMITNRLIGTIRSCISTSEAHSWLYDHPDSIDLPSIANRLGSWKTMTPLQLSELIHIFHKHAPVNMLVDFSGLLSESNIADLYTSEGPSFPHRERYHCQANIALIGISQREFGECKSNDFKEPLHRVIHSLATSGKINMDSVDLIKSLSQERWIEAWGSKSKQDFACLIRELVSQLELRESDDISSYMIKALNGWADLLEGKKSIIRRRRPTKEYRQN